MPRAVVRQLQHDRQRRDGYNMTGSSAMGSSVMATQQVAVAHGMTRGSAVVVVQRTAARPW